MRAIWQPQENVCFGNFALYLFVLSFAAHYNKNNPFPAILHLCRKGTKSVTRKSILLTFTFRFPSFSSTTP